MFYIVATPIGNLSEFNIRAQEVLNSADYILCEDTRTSGILLNRYNIKKPLKSYHKFNEVQSLNKIIDDLKQNKNIALISDAGMPAISDPGKIVINEIIKNNLEYTVVSGACALVNAFVLSGYNSPFTFFGFLPEKVSDKNDLLMPYKNIVGSFIFYCSCHNISKDIEYLHEVFGNKPICVAREITKLHEEVVFSDLKTGFNGTKKGEFVLMVNNTQNENPLNELSIKDHLLHYISQGVKKQDAIKYVCADRQIKKSDVYKHSIDL